MSDVISALIECLEAPVSRGFGFLGHRNVALRSQRHDRVSPRKTDGKPQLISALINHSETPEHRGFDFLGHRKIVLRSRPYRVHSTGAGQLQEFISALIMPAGAAVPVLVQISSKKDVVKRRFEKGGLMPPPK
jgi:hypothetical protein